MKAFYIYKFFSQSGRENTVIVLIVVSIKHHLFKNTRISTTREHKGPIT